MHPPFPTPAVHLTLSPTRTRAGAGAEANPTAALKAMEDTPQSSRARPPQLLSKPKPNPPSSPPPPPPISGSATTSPASHDDFSFPSPFGSHHLRPLSMSRAPVGRVGSDLSHLNHARANHRHHATTSNGGGISSSSKDRDRDSKVKNKASPFFSGLAAAWRKESSGGGGDVVTGKQQAAEEKRKDRAKQRALDVGQWVKRHMASMVEQLRASLFSRHQSERERREHQRRRPHSFSGHGPGAVREMRERERWRRRRVQLSSAPASLRVSPANSGHLSVGGSVKVSTSSEESTMEELQSAIEAAIAHCKNSISVAKQTAAAAAGDDTSKLE
ncbi:probable BRI1 kinase inhibitor 1 [Sorghum bicolor]|uniref:BRI1 kinase inhibitor 1 n=1 Tax=Sorghum bicolor TaxID=4558 RepID=A0A1W0W5C8_SORBI|nr:probable BRI1 kinase inhibitor 1 [Sorghum bicolor]OQU89614.1 hypothetical protein SORBI_3002G226700 [Sorghum bicolor]|eukprot:XP_002462492.2 probable BRI1 kinase inhibitor 1 [Sorghum bicolor]